MAWSDAARQAALQARRAHAKPVSRNVYVTQRQSPSKPNWVLGYAGVGAVQYVRGRAEGLRVARGKRFRDEIAYQLKRQRQDRGYRTDGGTYHYTWSGKTERAARGSRPLRIKVFIPD